MSEFKAWLCSPFTVMTAVIVVLFALWMRDHAAIKNQADIAETKAMLAAAEGDYAKLVATKGELERENADLEKRANAHKAEAAAALAEVELGKARIAELERKAVDDRLKVRQLRTDDALEDLFMQTFPQVARAANTGITELASGDIVLPYFVLPAYFVETFIIEHNNLGIANEELAVFRDNEQKYGKVVSLYAEVEKLRHQQKRNSAEIVKAVSNAERQCAVRLESLAERHIDYLEKPRFELPGGAKMLGCAALGAAAAFGISKAW